MKNRTKTGFLKSIELWGIIFLIGVSLCIVGIDVIDALREFDSSADEIRKNYISDQKQIIKQEVDHVVSMIRYRHAQSETLTREKIKSRVYEAYSVAQNIYQQNKNFRSESEIQKMIIEALRPIRFENGSGYYFILRVDSIEIMYAVKPEMEGLNLSDIQDTDGRFVIKDTIDIAKHSNEGFYEYHWAKPELKGDGLKKISFVKYFKPYKWIIGTGLYVDDVDNQIKAELLATISRIRFGKEGYIFVNRLNGDALVSNGKRFDGTRKLWEVFGDDPEKMKNIFEMEHNAALKPGGDYVYYSHIKLTDPNQVSQKASFIYGIPELKWLVGAGVYLDDVETHIALMQNKVYDQIKHRMFFFIMFGFLIIGLFILFFRRLNGRLKSDINIFFSFFEKAANSDEQIDREHIKFIELDQMAAYANTMLADRKQAESALRESEQRHRDLLSRLPIGVYRNTPDPSGRFIMANEAIAGMFGYESVEEFIQAAAPLSGLYVDPGQRDVFSKPLGTGSESDAVLLHLKKKDGTPFWASVKARAVRNDQGEIDYFDGIIEDITDRKQTEEEKEKLRAQLSQAKKMESVGRLAGGVAHDFNNMLGVILGYAELAMEKVDSTQPLFTQLEEIQKAAQQSAAVTQQLLAFARKQTIAPEVLDLNQTVQSMLTMIRRLIGEDINLTWLPGDSLWPVRMDPSQLDQILANLCINARDAIDGVGKLTIETDKVTFDEEYCADYADSIPGDFVLLAVSDDGCGMDKKTMNNIFEPFFTTKDVDRGTGLGLATVYGIVKQNNGFVNVYSETNEGTTFKIYLPRHELKKEEGRETGPEIPDARGGETILLVEDEPSIIGMATAMLEGLGYNVLAARTPGDAITIARRYDGQIHLLIIDVVMPEMNGRDLADNLLSIYPHLKCLFMSGYTANVIAHHGVLEEGVNFIQKPFSKKDLSIKVREALDGL